MIEVAPYRITFGARREQRGNKKMWELNRLAATLCSICKVVVLANANPALWLTSATVYLGINRYLIIIRH